MIPEDLDSIVQWLADEFTKRNKKDAIVGVSGGIDSAVVFSLCMEEPDLRVHPITMPSSYSSQEAMTRAANLIGMSGTPWAERHCISPPYLIWDRVRIGNFCARMRMATLYDIAAEFNGLVVGTSNATEIALGYGTRWGDTACDIMPLGNLYKREVRQLAEWLDVPKEIRTAVPSADLWEGQTDEGELGFTYEEADDYLMRVPYSCCDEPAVNAKIREKIEARIAANKFKSEPIPAFKPRNYAR